MTSSTDFERAVAELNAAHWRSELTVQQINSPQRIAPDSAAISAEVIHRGVDLADGRFILLHDPAGNSAWGGRFRCVTFVRAEVDHDMVSDPLLPGVGWSWLIDALEAHRARYDSPAGTVTAIYSKGFGAMSENQDQAEVELRASWTAQLDSHHALTPHLLAWQDVLCSVAGLPILCDGVVSLNWNSPRR